MLSKNPDAAAGVGASSGPASRLRLIARFFTKGAMLGGVAVSGEDAYPRRNRHSTKRSDDLNVSL